IGAEQKHLTLPTGFRSPPQNDRSRYGHLTARFAPFPELGPYQRKRLSLNAINCFPVSAMRGELCLFSFRPAFPRSCKFDARVHGFARKYQEESDRTPYRRRITQGIVRPCTIMENTTTA